jgi:UDP-N-acetylglucosamine--N-acetylmuramyl-(pentapeptide) pyrophosphoryl-undecaprenol N-acetylglucosamine transferase
VLAVFGGSLGALRLNRAVLDALPAWAARTDLAVHHVVGERDWELVVRSVPALPVGGLDYRPVRYEDRMPLLLAAADLFVCRAGATTVSELAAVGVPAVLVPLPGAPGDHQTANARVFEKAGAAVLVPDGELDGARLATEVDGLLGVPERLDAMAKAAAGLARRDAADRVAALVEEHAGG